MSINQTFNSYYLEMFIEELKEEIIKLKHELRCEKNLKESAVKTVKELERDLEHRDSVLSIMYDLLRSDLGDYDILCMIDAVIISECGDELTTNDRELVDKFWKRDFRS